jgi:hypothetical protein
MRAFVVSVIAFIVLCACPDVLGFQTRPLTRRVIGVQQPKMSVLDTASSLVDALIRKTDPSEASKEFYFFFFGGSGALGIGAAQVPKILAEFDALKKLGGSSITEGGDDLTINPIATIGYPEPLKTKDVLKVIKKLPTVKQIEAKGKKTSYMAQCGYLERQGFTDCLPDCNPLAVNAAYEAISSGGGDLVSPVDAEKVIANWKQNGIEGFKNDLTSAAVRKFSAYAVFGFLIALVLDLIVESGIYAFLQ